MRVEHTERTVYTFDELSDRAKDKARDWYRQGLEGDNYFAESVIEDAARMADMLGINLRSRTAKLMGGGTRQEPTVYWSGFSSQGDGASFEGSYAYVKGSATKIAEEAPEGDEKTYKQNNRLNQIARDLRDVQRRNFYQLQASITQSGHYQHEHTMRIEVERADDKPVSDDDAEELREALRDFARWIYRGLEAEYEYQMSDEAVDENIKANEYEFTEDGDRA